MASRQVVPLKPPVMSEKSLQELVRRTALAFNWQHYHTHNSRRSEAGFPDSFMVRNGRIVIAELKTARGKLSMQQLLWLAALSAVPGIKVYVWRPSSWYDGTIERVLRGED